MIKKYIIYIFIYNIKYDKIRNKRIHFMEKRVKH